jgi:hypothetical protein
LSDSTFGPYPPAVALYDSANNSQANACALEILGPVQPLEHLKELAGILHIETRAIVLHTKCDHSGFGAHGIDYHFWFG